MVNGITTNHERFGELSALALVGQISPDEYQELLDHLQSCAPCREEYRDFAAILSTELPLLHEQPSLTENKSTGIRDFGRVEGETGKTSRVDPGRFGDSGFDHQSRTLNETRRFWPLVANVPRLTATASLVLVVLLIFLGLEIRRHVARERSLEAALSALNAENGRLRSQISSRPPAAPNVPAHQGDIRADKPNEQYELAVHALQAQLKASRSELQLLKDELEKTRGQETEISASAHDIQERLEKTGQELEAVTQDRNQALASAQNKEQELEALTLELSLAQDSVERDRRLLAANRDIRDLMGARNLRIIDVFDVDSKGQTRKPFGRVFFTEGKSLVFYAFDLDRDSRSLQAAAFQGWGSKSQDRSTARSLGIFYRDDQNANRWFLKFDNPRVLAEIDSVFVTIEPPGGSRKPTGARLLPAFLKADLNHP